MSDNANDNGSNESDAAGPEVVMEKADMAMAGTMANATLQTIMSWKAKDKKTPHTLILIIPPADDNGESPTLTVYCGSVDNPDYVATLTDIAAKLGAQDGTERHLLSTEGFGVVPTPLN